ncbi:MAG: hypothetical protein ACP5Q4_10000, partial [Candidatus Caldatribacteriaceae bacterium]
SLAFQDEALLWRAQKAADFLLERVVDPSGRVFHLFTGEPALQGYLDDYAFLTFGLLELYRASLKAEYLRAALRITETMLELFSNPQGGFFFTAHDAQTPLLRPQVFSDGAIPSGNSVAVENLLRLGRLLFRVDFEQTATQALERLTPFLETNPLSSSYLAKVLFLLLRPDPQVILVAPSDHPDLPFILSTLKRESSSLLFLPEDTRYGYPWNLLPEGLDFRSLFGQPTFYLCRHFTCEEPTTDFARVIPHLRS